MTILTSRTCLGEFINEIYDNLSKLHEEIKPSTTLEESLHFFLYVQGRTLSKNGKHLVKKLCEIIKEQEEDGA